NPIPQNLAPTGRLINKIKSRPQPILIMYRRPRKNYLVIVSYLIKRNRYVLSAEEAASPLLSKTGNQHQDQPAILSRNLPKKNNSIARRLKVIFRSVEMPEIIINPERQPRPSNKFKNTAKKPNSCRDKIPTSNLRLAKGLTIPIMSK